MAKQIVKYLLLAVLLGIVISVTWLFWPRESSQVWKLIPDDAYYVLQSNDPISEWKLFTESSFWQANRNHPSLASVDNEIVYLDSLLLANKSLLPFFEGRELFLSAHPISNGQEFLYFIDLESEQKSKTLSIVLTNWLKSKGYKVSKTKDFYACFSANENSFYFQNYGSFIGFSYQKQLMVKICASGSFVPYSKNVELFGSSNTKLFLNVNQIDGLVKHYITDVPAFVMLLKSVLHDARASFGFDVDRATLKGYSNYNFKNSSNFVQTVLKKGVEEVRYTDILSAKTAWYSCFAFADFNILKTEMKAGLDHPALKEYNVQLEKFNVFFGEDVENLLTSWVGHEIILAQMDYRRSITGDEDIALFIHTKDVEKTKQSLNQLEQKIQKRTPGKFKQIDFQNHTITYLGLQGLFKPFLTNSIRDFKLPYYTILGNYFILSSDPMTLAGLIDDFQNKTVLKYDPIYQEYVNSVSNFTTIDMYISPLHCGQFMGKWMKGSANKAESIKSVLSFKTIGLQLLSYTDECKIELTMLSNTTSGKMDTAYDLAQKYSKYAGSNSDYKAMEWVDDGVYMRFFEGGDIVQIKADTKNDLLHGVYKEYYVNGNLLASGKYKKGKKNGLWKYYHPTGEFDFKKRY